LQRRFRQTKDRGCCGAIADRHAERRTKLGHPCKGKLGVYVLRSELNAISVARRWSLPRESHAGRPDSQSKHESIATRLDHANSCESERTANRRLPRHWHLDPRREDPKTSIRVGPL